MALPSRKNTRLRTWDYSNTAWYFVTICCYERQKLFGEVVDTAGTPISSIPSDQWASIGECTMRPSAAGHACAEVLKAAESSSSSARIAAYVVMPNHVHFVAAMKRDGNSSSSLSDFVRFVKSSVTKAVRRTKPGTIVWQKGYHEHVVRDDSDLDRVLEYIANNPAKWANDRYFA